MWSIELLAEAATEVEDLPKDMRAKLLHISEMIKTFGLHKVGLPYVRFLEQGLWEIRLKGRDGIARALYVTAHEKRVVIVRVFRKKTQKTPRKEIELALKRAVEVKNGKV